MQSGSYRIERVSLEELVQLRQLSIDTFVDTFSKQNNPENMEAYLSKAFKESQLKAELENPDSFFYFLKSADQTLGYLKLNTKSAQTDQVMDSALEIERIYVVRSAHGQGFGKALLEFALEEAKKRSLLSIWLGVWERNEKAIAFYKSYDFEVFDTHPFKLGDDMQRDLLMKRFV
ncbi:MAG: GNAT family N-acetyltransferase [Cytophagia bacterium]|nr:GNAT family N-acetyltransferase [Cytophagia bacterium]